MAEAAERIISFKQKISKEWPEKQSNKQVVDVFIDSDNESESDGKPIIKDMVLTKANKKLFYFIFFYQFILCLIKLKINYLLKKIWINKMYHL